MYSYYKSFDIDSFNDYVYTIQGQIHLTLNGQGKDTKYSKWVTHEALFSLLQPVLGIVQFLIYVHLVQ